VDAVHPLMLSRHAYAQSCVSPHLQAGVDLQEVKLASVVIDNELHRAGRAAGEGEKKRWMDPTPRPGARRYAP
jgi:hypothetical protein